MNKNQIVVMNGKLFVSKAFYKKACLFGSDEYYMLRKAQAENEGYEIVFKCADKKTHAGLTFKRMKAYIRTQPNADERMLEFDAVQRIAEAKGAKYPLTKEWFFLTYPEFKKDAVSVEEKELIVDELKNAQEEKAKAEAEKKIAFLSGSQSSNEDHPAAVGF